MIDLSQLPSPDVVESLDFEVIYQEITAQFASLYPEFDTLLESDPAIKLLELAAYREVQIRARINDAARAVMLASATGANLDQIGANYDVARLLIQPADNTAIPPTPATYENDSDFRYRIQLSMEGLSTAGPAGSYLFHALSADGQVLDASATSPAPGEVLITVLSREGNGSPTAELLAAVLAALNDENVRPLTDFVQVQAATIVPYEVNATLHFYAGPDRQVAMASARAAVEAYTQRQHRLGMDVTLSGIYAAAHQPGVQRVELATPPANLAIDRQTAAYCTGITLTDGGLDE